MAISKKSYDKLPENIRRLVLSVAQEVTAFQRAEVQRMEDAYKEKIKQQGVQIDEVNESLRKILKEKSIQVMEKHRMQIGTELIEIFLQELQEARGYEHDGLVVALDADLAGNSSLSGLAIRRGIELAMEEINAKGGLLGKQLSLVTRDNSMISARGLNNIEKFSQIPKLLAVFSGISSPVALSEIDLVHEKKILFLDPWAAATGIVDNNKQPNFVFRASVRDEYAGGFLLNKALELSNKVGVLLANNGWGRSNHQAITEAIMAKGLSLTATQWFDWGDDRLSEKLDKLYADGVEVIIYVGNTLEGAKLVKDMAARKKQIPIISHWGVMGADFYGITGGDVAKIDFQVLQTFSFINNPDPQVLALVERYKKKYAVDSVEDIVAPVGTAHAYDLMQLLALAVAKAGSSDMRKVRDAMENLGQYDGLVRVYQPPFSAQRHDALNADDFFLARYNGRTLAKVQ